MTAAEQSPDNVTPLTAKRPRRRKATRGISVLSSGQVRVAEQFAERYRGRFMHVDRIGWHEWAGSHWKLVPDKRAATAVKHLIQQLLHEAVECTPDVRDQWFADIRRCESANGLAGVAKIAAGLEGISVDPEDVDMHPELVAFRNCTYNLDTDQWTPPDPSHLITKVMGCDYNPDAECSWYDKMFAESQPDPVMRAYIHRQIGSALEGRVRVHMFPVNCGTGGNGKGSTLNDSWLPVFGDYGISINVEILLAKSDKDYVTERLALKGARYVVTSEPKRAARFNEALLKLIAGGDRMSCRPLYSNQTVNWEPTHQAFMLCNYRPEPPADDGGIWRRVKPVDWPNKVPEDQIDTLLPQKLRGELSGIANRILAGWRDFRDNGLQEPEESRDLREEWRNEVDVLGKFLAEWCDVDATRDDLRTKSSQLFVKWSSFCHDVNEPPGNNKELTQTLKRRGFRFKQTKHGAFALGIKIRQPTAFDFDEPEGEG
jgi:putative DNA primase/helicase